MPRTVLALIAELGKLCPKVCNLLLLSLELLEAPATGAQAPCVHELAHADG